MTIVVSEPPPCATEPEVYQHDVLQAPPGRGEMTAAQRREQRAMQQTAHRQCAGCPLWADCLYRAVVEVDVAGFVACTTEPQRRRIRRELGIAQAAVGLDAPRSGGGPVDHAAVMTLRQSHPHDTCQQLADRLGCSVSTVKRHLRRARDGEAAPPAPAPRPLAPTVDAVLDCFDRL